MSDVLKVLNKIQIELKVGKNKKNNFANFKYRSCSDILESVKPLLEKYKVTLTLSDDVIQLGERFYIKVTARLKHISTNEFEEVTSIAREPEEQKGMGAGQLSGATISYARKYALAGLFALDDEDDLDAKENK